MSHAANSVPYLLVVIFMVACLGACTSRQASYSDFKHISPSGWTHEEPYYFTPEYADSSKTYDIYIALRHEDDFLYSDVNFVVDFIHSNGEMERHNLDIVLSDRNGNWSGSGFGALYQMTMLVKQGVKAGEIPKVVVWQGMKCDTLTQITDIGIMIKPN